jgi:small-conductance mechanosensitive channel
MGINWHKIASDLDVPFQGNTLREWVIAVGAALALFLLLKLMQTILVSRLRRLSEKFTTEAGLLFLEALASVRLWFLLIVAIFAGSLLLALPPKTTQILITGTILALLLQAALTGNALLTLAIQGYSKKKLQTDAASVTTVTTLGFLGKLALWTILALLALQNVGVDVTALVAGLGIGGIAIALAAQNILGDLFASLSIVLDKPFVLGDFIIVGDQSGTVEKIGIRTTHLRSLTGDQLIIANNDLIKSRIRNCKRMSERRMAFNINVPYETPPEKLAAIPMLLREAIEKQQPIRFDRAHFKTLAASALEFEAVYFVLSPDNNQSMDIQQAINLWLIERFAKEEIRFAYPTQTVHLQREAQPTRGDDKEP